MHAAATPANAAGKLGTIARRLRLRRRTVPARVLARTKREAGTEPLCFTSGVAGELFWITSFVESKKTAFAVARLGMYTGLPLRSFTETSEHQPLELARAFKAVLNLLDTAEQRELEAYLQTHLGHPVQLYDPSL